MQRKLPTNEYFVKNYQRTRRKTGIPNKHEEIVDDSTVLHFDCSLENHVCVETLVRKVIP